MSTDIGRYVKSILLPRKHNSSLHGIKTSELSYKSSSDGNLQASRLWPIWFLIAFPLRRTDDRSFTLSFPINIPDNDNYREESPSCCLWHSCGFDLSMILRNHVLCITPTDLSPQSLLKFTSADLKFPLQVHGKISEIKIINVSYRFAFLIFTSRVPQRCLRLKRCQSAVNIIIIVWLVADRKGRP